MHALRLYRPEDDDAPISEPSPKIPPPAGIRDGADPTIAELVTAYLGDVKADLAKDTYADHERTLRRLSTEFGTRKPDGLRPSDFRAWIHGQESWAAENTRWCRANVVQRLFNWAVTDRRITANPIKGVRVKKGSRRRATTEAEYQLMLKASSPCFRRALVFLRWNGCRPQDMTRLQWEWIVWRDGRPYKAVVPKDRHKTGGKTGKDKVILFAPVACQLVSWLARRPPEQPARTGHVFQNSRGEPWTRGALSQRLGQIRDDTKISIEATFHGLRHLVGTQWVARGGSMDLLAAWMCHMTSRTTETYYVHREVMEIELLEQARLLIGPRTNRS